MCQTTATIQQSTEGIFYASVSGSIKIYLIWITNEVCNASNTLTTYSTKYLVPIQQFGLK
jgi:hypothetical protein